MAETYNSKRRATIGREIGAPKISNKHFYGFNDYYIKAHKDGKEIKIKAI